MQQHTSFGNASSTSNIINTKDSNSGDDDDTKFKDLSKSVDEGVISAKVPYDYKDHPLTLASPLLRRLMNQEDMTSADPSNGDVDPTPTDNVQRKLQQSVGSGSCNPADTCALKDSGSFPSCDTCTDVTSTSEIGDNSCLDFRSCFELDGMYNYNNTRECIVCCTALLHINSTNTYLCNSSLFNKVLLVMDRALILIPVLNLVAVDFHTRALV